MRHTVTRGFRRRVSRLVPVCAALALVPVCADAAELNAPEFLKIEATNGMTLYVAEDHALPVVVVRLALPAGQAYEPRGKKGLAWFTANTCLLGVPGLESTALLTERQRLGTEYTAWADQDHIYFALNCLRENWTAALDLLARAIVTPTFPGREVARLRNEGVAEQRRLRRDPSALARMHAYDLLYDGPLAWPSSAEGNRRIGRDDLVAFHRTFYVPDRAILVAIGDFDRAAAAETLRAAFQGWARGSAPPSPVPSVVRDDGPRVRLVHKPGLTQATIACIQPGPTSVDPGRFAFRLGNAVLGGGSSSRLRVNLRSEGGKTYSVSSSHVSQLRQGQLYISTYTRNPELGASLDSIRSVVSLLVRDGVRPDELDTARRIYLGGMILGMETTQDVAWRLLNALAAGQTLEEWRALPARYEAVTPQMADEAIRGRLHPDSLRWIIVADKRAIGDALARLGPFETVDSRDPIRPGNPLQRTRVGLGLSWNRAGRGPRVSLLHRWIDLHGMYGPSSWNTRWERGEVLQAGLDLHRTSSERGAASLYLGVTGTWKDSRRGFSPHAGFRLFPSAFGDHWSFATGLGASFWSRGPRSELQWSVGLDRFL